MTDAMQLDMLAILERLPHRYPFLLVDRVLECHPGKSIRALKNVTYNEPFFPGHFPGRPVMPGVMIIEALAQAGGHPVLRHRRDHSRREHAFLLRRHRQGALPPPGGPGRPAHAEASWSARCAASGASPPCALVGEQEVAHADMMLARRRAQVIDARARRHRRRRSSRPT